MNLVLGIPLIVMGLAQFIDEFRRFNLEGMPEESRLWVVTLSGLVMGLGVNVIVNT